jgi:hypothetical protein
LPHSLPLRLSLALAFSLPGASALQAEPETLPSGNFLLWQPEQRPAGFSHMDRIFPTRVVKAGAIPVPVQGAA